MLPRLGRTNGGKKTLNELYKKDLREKACRDLVRWFYDVGNFFHATTFDSFDIACESIS